MKVDKTSEVADKIDTILAKKGKCRLFGLRGVCYKNGKLFIKYQAHWDSFSWFVKWDGVTVFRVERGEWGNYYEYTNIDLPPWKEALEVEYCIVEEENKNIHLIATKEANPETK